MTKNIEETIEIIKAYREKLINSPSNQLDKDIQAFNIAIQVLQQEPCGDAVSRQTVLKKIDYEVEHYCKYLEEVEDKRNAQTHVALVSDNIREEVEQLPSVTVRQSECLKAQAKKQVMPMSCDDCCHEPNSPFCEMYRKDICEKKDGRQTGEWIPVSERLPEAEYGESDSVLVCFENETQDVLYFDGGNWRYPTGELYISVNHKNGWHNKVIAWQPLPEPYKEEGAE